MPRSWRNYLVGTGLALLGGALIGAAYDATITGLLVVALLVILWQIRQLFSFERALRTGNFDAFRFGDGIWEQMFARFRFEQDRSARHKKRYRELLREIRKSTNAMPDAAVIIDSNDEILMCNRAAKQLVGLRPKKDKGQRVDNILRDEALTALLKSGSYKDSIEIESPVRPGEWLNCRVVPYGIDQKLLLIRDVTERLRLAKMRRDFVANASHELRSPLTVISGYLDGYGEDELPEELKFPFAQMRAQAQRMNQVISELLELSRVESAGRANVERPVDVAALMHSVVRPFDGRSGMPSFRVDADDSISLLGNETQIESVIRNLVTNAIRHTPADGKIRLQWSRNKKGALLSVRDTGEGIAPEHLPRITERFFRVDRGRSRDDGGVGLGLAIVKHILHRHDGELQVESTPGEGSTFSCQFPAERVRKSSMPARAG